MSPLYAAGAGLLVGCAAGIGATAWAMNEYVVDPALHTHAAEMLEYYLDENTLTLANVGAPAMDDPDRKILARMAAYRQQFPRHSSRPDVDHAVDDFLKQYR